MENQIGQNPIPKSTPPMVSPVELPKPKSNRILVIFLSVLLVLTVLIAGLFYFQIQKLSKEILKYQSAIVTPPPSANPAGSEGKVFCPTKRPEVCTMECIQNPPYICGSDGKSYCSTCQACSNKDVAWYTMQATPCEKE